MEVVGGTYPAGEFLDGLRDSDRRKLDLLFERMGDEGRIYNREKFKKVEGSDGIFAFKSHQNRLLCFFTPEKELLLAYGLVKKADKYKKSEIDRAEEMKAFFFSQRDGGG